MMTSLVNSKVFIITYDAGEETQTLMVPHDVFRNEDEFGKNIITMKCLVCNFESIFTDEEKS